MLQEKWEYLFVNQREENNQTICTYEIEKIKNEAPSYFRNATFSLHAGLQYEFVRNLNISFSGRKTLSNMYVDDGFRFRDQNYRPWTLHLGLAYTIGGASELD